MIVLVIVIAVVLLAVRVSLVMEKFPASNGVLGTPPQILS